MNSMMQYIISFFLIVYLFVMIIFTIDEINGVPMGCQVGIFPLLMFYYQFLLWYPKKTIEPHGISSL